MQTFTIETLDPHTTGTITSNGEFIEEIFFDFHTEDAQEWEELADAELNRNGWTRTSDWENNTATVTRK